MEVDYNLGLLSYFYINPGYNTKYDSGNINSFYSIAGDIAQDSEMKWI